MDHSFDRSGRGYVFSINFSTCKKLGNENDRGIRVG